MATSGRKPEGAISWSINRAASEFGLTNQTLTRRLNAQGIQPNAEGAYTTKQIVSAVYGDKEGEKVRLTHEQADKVALENATARRELVKMEDVERVWAEWLIGVRNSVKEQEIPQEAKQNILAAMREINPEDYFKEATGDEEESSEQA